MSTELPSQASFWGLREQELRVLMVITYWFNGRPMTIRGEERRIATHHDLPLDEMFRAWDLDYEDHEHAHERLLDNEFLQEEYICRRKIDWAPTERGIRAIRDCLKTVSDKVRPRWADEDADGPIYGDPNEGTLHRKGVEIAGDVLPGMAWAWSMEMNGRPYGVEWYPTDRRGEACHDLHVDTNERMNDVGVEVITASNNIEHLVGKWERFASEDRTTFWLFDRRQTACRLFNELDNRGLFFLDGQFRNPGNWSAKAINQKIWRSADTYERNEFGDVVHTITGLLEGDADTVQDLFESYYSVK